MKRISTIAVIIGIMGVMVATPSFAQDYSQLDPAPYDPETDPDIDLYMASWKESMPRSSHGSLVERDILVRGDALNPERRGAVLTQVKRFAYATLESRGETAPTVLDGEQEVFYILSGKGEVSAGGETAVLHHGVGVLIPEGLSFTMTNTGDEPLTMYLLVEPVPAGFTPNRSMTVVDENEKALNQGNPHWVGCSKTLFSSASGLATLTSVLTVRFDPQTFFHPHSHGPGIEEVWTTIYGDLHVLIGKQIRHQPPGTGYNIPPDGKTPHANFNVSNDMGKLFYFSRFPGN